MASEGIDKIQILGYIKKYDETKYLYEVIGPAIRGRGFVTRPEFIKICTWKTARQKKRYLSNDAKEIENITREAFHIEDEAEKIEKLNELKGVRYPVASSILSVAYPMNYPIIDIRCISSLNKMGIPISKNVTRNVWLKYLSIMRRLAKEYEITPRQMDMALYSMSVEKDEQNNFKDLYSKRVVRV